MKKKIICFAILGMFLLLSSIPLLVIGQKVETTEKTSSIGDDLPDLPILRRVGLAITVPDASAVIQQHVDLITKCKGGYGAVREACEFIMVAQDQYKVMIQSYVIS